MYNPAVTPHRPVVSRPGRGLRAVRPGWRNRYGRRPRRTLKRITLKRRRLAGSPISSRAAFQSNAPRSATAICRSSTSAADGNGLSAKMDATGRKARHWRLMQRGAMPRPQRSILHACA